MHYLRNNDRGKDSHPSRTSLHPAADVQVFAMFVVFVERRRDRADEMGPRIAKEKSGVPVEGPG